MKLPRSLLNTIKMFTLEDTQRFLDSIKETEQETPSFRLIERLMSISILDGTYDARTHELLKRLSKLLNVPCVLLDLRCDSIYNILLIKTEKQRDKISDDSKKVQSLADKTTITSDKYINNDISKAKKIKKYMLMGLASLGGALVIGVTGGLAAPAVLSALAGVLGTGLAINAATAAILGPLFGSLFGVAGAGLTGFKMNKRIGDLEEFSFLSMNPRFDQTSLRITIAITGWILDESDSAFMQPWLPLRSTREQYCLRYETKYLLELSQSLENLINMFFSFAAQEALKYTFLAGLIAAVAWPATLIGMASIIDNPWQVCLNRATKAGHRLAQVLRSRQQGKRPVSLIGFSLGARVIFYCLQELAKYEDSLGIISDVTILGAPVSAAHDQWAPLMKLISGSLINGYSRSDWLLKFLYRTSNAAIHIAGLEEIRFNKNHRAERIRNIDLGHLVGGHMDYQKNMNQILDYIGLSTSTRQNNNFARRNSHIGSTSQQTKVIGDNKTTMIPISRCTANRHNLGSLELDKATLHEMSLIPRSKSLDFIYSTPSQDLNGSF